jgi:hypothetical protein
MREITLVLLFSASLIYPQYYIFAQNAGLSIPPGSIQNDPNLDPNWNWRFGDYPDRIYPDAAYKIYHLSDNGSVIPIMIQAPWTQANAWSGLLDNKKEDGWELLVRDFGTPSRPILGLTAEKPPYFILYNKFRSIIRVFVSIQNSDSWNRGFIELQFKDPADITKTPAVLANLKSVAAAVDKYYLMKNNVSSVFSDIFRKNNWLWADFPLSYDPTIQQKTDLDPPSFFFRIYGQNIQNIELKGIAQGAQGNATFVNNWLTGAIEGNGPFGIPDLHMPNLKVNPLAPDISLGNLKLRPFCTQTNWNSFTNYFSKIRIRIPKVDASNPFKGFFDNFSTKISSLTNVLPLSLPGLDISGLFDFFINGGAKSQVPAEPAPSFIAMNLELAGTITATIPVHEVRVTIPNTRDEFWNPTLGSTVGIVRNDPVGLITLSKTPKLNGKMFFKRIYYSSGYYSEIPFYEYEVAEDLQFVVNSNSGLIVKKIDAYLITDFNYVIDDRNRWLTNTFETTNQAFPFEYESPIDEFKVKIRSMPVPAQYIKGRKLIVGVNQKEVYVKIKAVLQRIDDANAQPVVYISTYKADKPIEYPNYDYGTYQHTPLPTIPPQNVICLFRSSHGVNVSWDRNLEKNIKYYAVERSINGGKYTLIGSTSDTVYIDTEIQKAVKTFQSYVSNVNVYYRVRALSEWKDESNITRSQFSNYSSVAYAYGSHNYGPMDKRQGFAYAPESNDVSQNFPNPFNPTTTIYYAVKDAGNVMIKIFNSLGQEIQTLVDEQKDAGYHYVEWNATGYPSGVYFYRITNGSYVETKRMILTK